MNLKRVKDSCLALGVEDGTIHSDQLTASSERTSYYKAYRGRLNTVPDAGGAGAWAAKYINQNQWIEADLGAIKGVIGVITQGRSNVNQWVKTYKVYYSTDGKNFTSVLGSSGQDETFNANYDQNTEVTNIFNSVVYAQFIRINPISWYVYISLRFELLGIAPLDITMFSAIPLISSNNENEFRGYAINNCKTTNLTIGILYKNVDGRNNVTWADTGHSDNTNGNTSDNLVNMPDNNIFNTRSQISYGVHTDFVYLGVKNLPNSYSDGVFSLEATKSAIVSRSAIVVTSALDSRPKEYFPRLDHNGLFIHNAVTNPLKYGQSIHTLVEGTTLSVPLQPSLGLNSYR
ncbi:EGF-like repeat and discoidin I-like domain-containing protein 3 [Anneissia japonica]|uniref:EGF-like repeat and discoidin I-like domain-containing protein 3 n=1 Tax=Anneissia japonica TaxID=1529436 RepID=UPI00142591C6|nr:EGF-like repeat and discoidin I-like domain-containing protein 3 [Anneissia japonica]